MKKPVRGTSTDSHLKALEAENAALRAQLHALERRVAERDALLALKSQALAEVREAVYLIDDAARFVYVNDEASRALGYSACELLQMTVMDIDPGFPFERWRATRDRLKQEGKWCGETWHRRKDGTRFPVEVRASHFIYEGRQYSLTFARDIAAQQEAQRRLEAQHEAEEQFVRLAESSPDIICRYDAQCRLRYANSGLSAILQRPLADLLGKTPNEHQPDMRFGQYQAEVEAAIRTGAAREIELTLPDRGDGEHYHHIRVIPERGPDGTTIGALALGRDITERKRAEERLHASEQAFRAVVEHSPDYIARYDLNLRRIYVNPALLALMGSTSDAVVGTTPGENSAFLDPQRYMAALRRAIETRGEISEEVRLRDWKGYIRWGNIRIVPEFAPNGEVASVLAINRDIDELKRSEDAFRALSENAPDPIIRYDRQCRRIYVNPEFERVSGSKAAELLGRSAGQVPGAPSDVVRRFRRKLKSIMATGVAKKFELTWDRFGQTVCWYVHAVPEFNADGEVQSILTIWRDITERKAVEQRLRESYEMLRELTSRRETAREEERRRIARELHDELGQQLTALRMGASALRLRFGQDNPALTEHVRKLLELVDQTMRVMRDAVSSLRPAALDAGIGAALEWLADEFTRNVGVACTARVTDDAPALAEQHAVALFRIVQEALTNVARHALAHHVRITLERGLHECLLEVRDDGCGFDPVATKHRSFGLAGMKERVLMLGGRIDIVSEPGKGTSIKVGVPIAPLGEVARSGALSE